MSILLADIDATCSSLGWDDGCKYHMEPDAIMGLKHLIWILKRDSDDHEYRRYIGQKKVMQTDLIPMLMSNFDNPDVADVLLRLIVNLTYPTLLLYQGHQPKDAVGRRHFLHLVEILQGYKEAFAVQQAWAALGDRLQMVLQVDWSERMEEQELIIERLLTLTRNVLHVPSNVDLEKRFDNDASLHDQVLWALQQAGVLDLILYILGSEHEHQYHLHALEIICLIYREQSATSLADASLQRSASEKHRDALELIKAKNMEKAKKTSRIPAARHSRFGGTYVMQNVKSISDNDLICHQSLQKALQMEFDTDKKRVKKSFRNVKETGTVERKSAFSVRLFLREYCIEVLRSSYNNLVRQVRRILERNAHGQEMSGGHDDSYLLWAIRFFMEFNRASGFQLDLVSESLSVQCFHWIITRIEHFVDMMVSDKTRARLWARRLHVAVQAYREMLQSLQALQKLQDEKAKDLFLMLQNNIFYVLEYREVILHLLINYKETNSTRAYLRDVVETAHMFFKMLEKYCQGTVRVQSKKRAKPKRNKNRQDNAASRKDPELDAETLEELWLTMAGEVSTCLANQITLPEEDHPIPFDGASDVPIDDQKGDCMIRIHSLLRDGKYEHAIILMRSAREVWPEDDCFGSSASAPEDELMLLKEIFLANLPRVAEKQHSVDNENNFENGADEYDDDEENEEDNQMTEIDFRFEDFAKRLLNPKVVHACTLVLSDWEKIPTASLKAAVTILHRIAVGCKMPVLLFQASLFRLFQRVFHAPKDAHQEELRRLGVYIVRQFTALAPNNPKIYAELLFYKSIKEANGIEMGYEDIYGNNIGKGGGLRGAWNEEQEEELRRLFMENQENPESDQDVIDWILDNLIDKTRSRRGIIKKLKELGLIFKAPTKKSNAAASNKNLWTSDQDEKLKQLYDGHRLNENVLAIITGEFDGTRSKQAIVKRMITLGLIADKSEVKPPRKSRSKKTPVEGGDPMSSGDLTSDSDEDDDHNRPSKPSKHTKTNQATKSSKARRSQSSKSTLNFKRLRTILSEIEESMKEAVEWLAESFAEASNDYEEGSQDPDDDVPLVPIMPLQREALEQPQFKELLHELGVDAPSNTEMYWRIPVSMKPDDLQLRVQILKGEHMAEEQPSPKDDIPEPSDDEVSEDLFSAWKNKTNVLYSKSDDESDVREPLKRKSAKETKKSTSRERTTKKKNDKQFDLNDLAKQPDEKADKTETDERLSDAELESLSDFPSHRSLVVTSDEDETSNVKAPVTSRKKKSKISTISDSESDLDQDKNGEEGINNANFKSTAEFKERRQAKSQVRSLIVSSDEDETTNDKAATISRSKKKSKNNVNSDPGLKSEMERFFEVSEDENGEERIYDGYSQSTRQKKSKIIRNPHSEPESDSEQVRLIVSDDEDGDGNSEPSASTKRGRSALSDLSDVEEKGVTKRTKHHRRAVISDDEED